MVAHASNAGQVSRNQQIASLPRTPLRIGVIKVRWILDLRLKITAGRNGNQNPQPEMRTTTPRDWLRDPRGLGVARLSS
jgi:hypothetical protein